MDDGGLYIVRRVAARPAVLLLGRVVSYSWAQGFSCLSTLSFFSKCFVFSSAFGMYHECRDGLWGLVVVSAPQLGVCAAIWASMVY
ncbi:hypothetical protein DFH27DRAFT_278000 [Peziza echinospora]|nr:hypothetical protein DFH27DRAFT_278000 [Peziza echinospora]